MTIFGRLNLDGSYEEIRQIPQSAMRLCPHIIMVAEHYREDNTCRCNDLTHSEMKDWGYVWSGVEGLWVCTEENDNEIQTERDE